MNFCLRGGPSDRISREMFVNLTKYMANQWCDFAQICGDMRAHQLGWMAER